MPTLPVTCPHCRTPVPLGGAGRPPRCPSCGHTFPTADAAPGWFLVRDRKRSGPFPHEYLQQLAAGGRLTPSDMVLQEGTRTWVPAESVAGLFAPLPVASPAPSASDPAPATGPAPVAAGAGQETTAEAAPPPAGTGPTLPPAAGAAGQAPDGYEILGVLGRGGMGVVYKARQVKLQRLVALKMILAGGHAGEEALARFKTEAEAVARLQHPGVVAVYEVGEWRPDDHSPALPFLALEFCPGGSLDRKLAGDPQPPREAAALVEKLARAMAAAHQKGVIHRDLKPANVLLAEDGTPKITDFGLAKKLDEAGQTQTGAIMGTPSYMAPEQAGGSSKEVGPAADVWALGATLYDCLTGHPPFKAATPMDTVLQVLTEEPVPPSRLLPHCPRDLETICLKCLQKEPHKRYSSAAALAEDLRRFLGHQPIRARPAGAWERARKWVRRRPAVAALMLVSAVALLVLLAGGVWHSATLRRALEQSEGRRQEAERERVEARRLERLATEERDRAQAAQAAERRTLYAAQMQLAQREWREAHIGQTLRLLNHWGPGENDLRGWEWFHLLGLCHADVRTWDAGAGQLNVLAFSPDGHWLAAAGYGNTVVLWETRTGRKARTLPGHANPVWGLAFSPDGKVLASAGDDWKVRLWDVAGGQAIHTLPHGAKVRGVAFSPDGTLATGGYDKVIRLWDAATGRALRTLGYHPGAVLRLAFSPDGRTLACAGFGGTTLWEVAGGGRLLHTLGGHTAQVSGVAFSPDGKTLATSSEDCTIRLWDVPSGTERSVLTGQTAWVHRVAFSPDGRWVAAALFDGTARLWDAESGRPVQVFRGHTDHVFDVAFSPSGQWLLSAAHNGTIKFWDPTLESQEYRSFQGHTDPVVRISFSPDGQSLASASRDRTVRLWDVESGKPGRVLGDHQAEVWGVAFSPDGKWLAWADDQGVINVWDRARHRLAHTLKGHTGAVRAVAFAPNGTLASGGFDGAVRLWDSTTSQPLRLLGNHLAAIQCLAFSPDGQSLASAGDDGTVRLWQAEGGKAERVLGGHKGAVFAVAFSPDGKLLASGGVDQTVRLWDAASGQPVREMTGHTDPVLGLAFSPDGRRLASAGGDHLVKLWDLVSGQELLTLKGHTSLVYSVAFSPDGKRLASAGSGEEIRLWDSAADRDRAREGPDLQLAGSSEEVLAWHRRAATACEDEQRWFAAAFHLGRLSVARPGAEIGSELALVRLGAGDREGYRQECAALVRDLDAASDDSVARAARVCPLAPAALPDLEPLLRRVEAAARKHPIESAFGHPLGRLLYRAGRDEEAIRRLQLALTIHGGEGSVADWLFLAMAHQRLGQADRARRWLSQAEHAIREEEAQNTARVVGVRPDWSVRLEHRLLWQEADALINGRDR